MTNPRPTTRALIVGGATVLGLAGVLAWNPTISSAHHISSPEQTPQANCPSPDHDRDRVRDQTPQPTSTSQSTSTNQPTSSISGTSGEGSYLGDAYQSPYGTMQVQVTVADDTITAIEWVQLPSDHRSQEINATAAPILVQAALSAQSAQVDSVSGASYTSEGFRVSLQSALDKAGL